ncbi:hypothetical protein TNCV_344031 [Trichonephila clavipes]|nr:hypothetical protein TNCV_344031 [Trichonephila clavipes]
MVNKISFRRGNQTGRPVVPKHHWSRTLVRKVGCRPVTRTSKNGESPEGSSKNLVPELLSAMAAPNAEVCEG